MCANEPDTARRTTILQRVSVAHVENSVYMCARTSRIFDVENVSQMSRHRKTSHGDIGTQQWRRRYTKSWDVRQHPRMLR